MDDMTAPITGTEILEKRNRIPNSIINYINIEIEDSFGKIYPNQAFLNKDRFVDVIVEHHQEIYGSDWKNHHKVIHQYFMDRIKIHYMKAGWAITEKNGDLDASDDCYVFEWPRSDRTRPKV